MKRCIIVGACSDSWREFTYDESDFIIASDGGYTFLKEHGYPISLVVGDFDSLHCVLETNNVKKLNVIKDVTDTHVSIEEGIKQGYKEFEIYGVIGGRIDHTLAAFQDVYKWVMMGYKFTLYSKNQIVRFIYNEKIEINQKEGYISIFSPSISKGVTLNGLKYELKDYTLTSSFPLGVSNEFINKKATIEVKDGCLIIIY
ncbi:MAG: thiamine diphosphokinase [Bacilli bacterium]